MLTDREVKEKRELRRRTRERQRLEKGDDYQSDAHSDEGIEEQEEDYDDETDSEEYDSEANESELQDAAVSELGGGLGGQSIVSLTKSLKKKRRGASSRMSDGMDIQYRFNALRFLAMNLKSQNETMKPPGTANGGASPPSSSGKGIPSGTF